MLLLCDIGNSTIKSAIFYKDSLNSFSSFQSLENFIKYLNQNNFKECAVSSVVPSTTELLKSYFKKKNIDFFFVTKEAKFNLSIDYKTPETLGIDRICSSEGAFFLYKNSKDFNLYNENTFLITADFGTATTLNFIKYPGIFIGGIISPGLDMMFHSLHSKTSQLPLAKISDYKTLIGDDTKSSVASGVVSAVKGLINESRNYVRKNYEVSDIKFYITGGNAINIKDYLEINFIYEKTLVLIGTKVIYDKNKKEI